MHKLMHRSFPMLLSLLSAAVAMHQTGSSAGTRDCAPGGCPTSEVTGRYSHCAEVFSTSAGHQMIIYGGQGFTGGMSPSTLGDAWAYDMMNDSWTLIQDIRASVNMLTSMPAPRSSHSCTLVNQNAVTGKADFLVFGGRVQRMAGSAETLTNEVWRLRLTDQRVTGEGTLVVGVWSRLYASTVEPVPRFDHTAVAYNGAILMYGGCENGASAFDDVWLLDYAGNGSNMASWTPLTPVPRVITPGRRCAHAAVPASEGMIVFGGRVPTLPAGASLDDPVWLSLSDSWAFSVRGQGYGMWTRMPLNEPNAQINRSDHTMVMNGQANALFIFGGLFTDVRLNSIYVYRDWLRIALSSVRSAPSQVTQLAWGPDWRFDHTMVLAPVVRHPLANRLLYNAPLLYAGGGGREIFNDMWVYDLQTNDWIKFPSDEAPIQVVNLITSLFFGTVGFGIYACVVVCVFVRRIALRSNRNRRLNSSTVDQRNQLHRLGNSPRRRGASPDEIRALPRVMWADLAKCEAIKVRESSSEGSGGGGGGDAEAATARTEGTSKPEETEEADVCSVCLVEYEAGDLLIRLPCEHAFHEACIGRWLETESTCPKCRFNIGWPAAQGPNRRHVRPPPDGIDEEAGIELDDVRRAAAAAREHASPPSQAAPPVVVESTGVRIQASSHPEPRIRPAPSPEA